MKKLYHWNARWEKRPSFMARAYYSPMRDKTLYAIFPFHYLVILLWWVNQKYARLASKPSWIDREIESKPQH